MTAEVPEVTPEDVAALLTEGALLLDVREVDEWQAGHAFKQLGSQRQRLRGSGFRRLSHPLCSQPAPSGVVPAVGSAQPNRVH